MKFSKDEQEIGIAINAADKEAVVTVTGYPKYMRKLEWLSSEFPEAYKLMGEEKDKNGIIYCRQYRIEKKYIRFGKPASEARIEASRRNAENMRINA